jgi:aryl carrier-like protein
MAHGPDPGGESAPSSGSSLDADLRSPWAALEVTELADARGPVKRLTRRQRGRRARPRRSADADGRQHCAEGRRALLPWPSPTPAAALLACSPLRSARASEQLMGFNPGDLDPKRPLAWQGFDSVMATDLQARLRADTGVELPLDSLVTGPRVTDLAADLLGRMDLTKVPAVSVPAAPIAAPVAQAAAGRPAGRAGPLRRSRRRRHGVAA